MDWGRIGSSVIRGIAVGVVVLVTVYLVFASSQSGLQSRNRCGFSGIYNFGDSNSDTGSVSTAFHYLGLPYGQTFFGQDSGRFSDGRLVIDFIAEYLRFPYLVAYLDSIGADFAHGANFAASGSTIEKMDAEVCVPDFNPLTLPVQVSQFEQFRNRTVKSYGTGKRRHCKVPLPKPRSFGKALFTIDSGQNDIDHALNSQTEDQVKALIPGMIYQFSINLEKLYKLGARSFWIHNTGPIGCLPKFLVKHPRALNNTDPNGCVKSYNDVAQEFNRQLREKISGLRSQLRGATLVYVDIYSVKYSLISQGKSQGFSNPLGVCCGKIDVVGCGKRAVVNGTELYGDACSNPSEYISWDGIHYTEAANKWIANRILEGGFSEPEVAIDEACYGHPSQTEEIAIKILAYEEDAYSRLPEPGLSTS